MAGLAMGKGLFAVLDQQFVEIAVGAADRHACDRNRERHLVHRGAEFDLASQQRAKFGRRPVAMMYHPYPARHYSAVGKLAEQANEGQQPEFDVVAVRPPFDADVFERDRDLPACAKFDRNSLVRDPAVADGVVQGVVQHLGRCQHIINQAECAKVIIARQTKAQQVIVQRVGSEFEELDLAPHLDAGAAIIDLLDAQSGLRQQRCRRDAVLAQVCICQAGNAARGARHRIDAPRSGSSHGSSSSIAVAVCGLFVANEPFWRRRSKYWRMIASRARAVC